ncbi:MAG: hypothetical protein K6G24_09860, partial [Lachnospiraceae bacterium]|nr:hypothetical protein [Lachnospiraceae bacterium]
MVKNNVLRGAILAMMLMLAGCSTGSNDTASKDKNISEQMETRDNSNTETVGNETEKTDDSNENVNSAVEGDTENTADEINDNNTQAEEETMDYEAIFKEIKLSKTYKGFMNNNPIIEQHYGADPFALVYDDTVYFYMTADAYEYDEKGEIKENSYSKIRSLYVVSTKDMINFTDHGEITIAGAGGATKWAHNSWAPAAAWKMVDGKPKFF